MATLKTRLPSDKTLTTFRIQDRSIGGKIKVRSNLEGYRTRDYRWRVIPSQYGYYYGYAQNSRVQKYSLKDDLTIIRSHYIYGKREVTLLSGRNIVASSSWPNRQELSSLNNVLRSSGRHSFGHVDSVIEGRSLWYRFTEQEIRHYRDSIHADGVAEAEHIYALSKQARRYMYYGWHSITDEMMDMQGLETTVYKTLHCYIMPRWTDLKDNQPGRHFNSIEHLVQIIGHPNVWFPTALLTTPVNKESEAYKTRLNEQKYERRQKSEVNLFNGEDLDFY